MPKKVNVQNSILSKKQKVKNTNVQNSILSKKVKVQFHKSILFRRGHGGEQIFAQRANTRGTTIGCSTKGVPLLGTKGALNLGSPSVN